MTETLVRRASEDDLEQVLELQMARNGEDTEEMLRALWAAPDVGPGMFTVAACDGRVVSSLCLIAETMRLEGITLPAAQVGFVATVTEHEHRGLVRRQIDMVHAWSRERGDLAQVIAGIPYFYRLFGYEYAIAFPRVRLVIPGIELAMPPGWSVRAATVADLESVMALQHAAQADAPLAATRSEWWWHWSLANPDGGWLVAEKDGRVRGAASAGGGPPGVGGSVSMLGRVASERHGAVWALLAAAAARGKPVAIEERAGQTAVVDGISHRHPRDYALYVRVDDPVAFLDRIRPVLTARLARSHRAGMSGRLLLSLYASSIVITYARGEVTAVEGGPSVQNPTSAGGAGVPPDLVATLLFGRYGAADLAARCADVDLGTVADLMEIFFPRLEGDLQLSL